MNPFLNLPYEPALESLGEAYYQIVAAAAFPQQILRFRNNALLPLLGLDPSHVADEHFQEAFGRFQGRVPLLALSYHGYQFGVYNPNLGDGRGFLYGQVRGVDGNLYDLGTKGSGQTPYSRGGDGRLTLKGGVREVLAAETLKAQGVNTSRCLSLIETGEQLWRGDEPSPTRSSVMVRLSQSHIRFGTFERLHYLGRSDLIQRLLDHVLEVYYPHLWPQEQAYARFYTELVARVADVSAQWMAAGFCHGVLNTDNMSITGESFDYGPYGFIPAYDLRFTAAYFDDLGRYCYGNQAPICKDNLRKLQQPLGAVLGVEEMEKSLDTFDDRFRDTFTTLMVHRLGFDHLESPLDRQLIKLTLELLQQHQGSYHGFFRRLRQGFTPTWAEYPDQIPPQLFDPELEPNQDTPNLKPISQTPYGEQWCEWRDLYHLSLSRLSPSELATIGPRLSRHNPLTALVRPVIEAVWQAIDEEDNWQPFDTLVKQLQALQ